ncbi:MAG: phosphate ABC transporter substrate-binding protein PstS [Candidatus Acidiferrales bacterium]
MKIRRRLSPNATHRSSGRSRRSLAWFAAVLAAGLGCWAVQAQDALVVVGSGSSVPAPLYNRWAQEYNKRSPGTQMRYLPIGTSEGIKQISHGSGDFGAGEVALTSSERADAKLIELPAVLIAIVPYYHLPGPGVVLRFSGDLLAGIFLGEIKNWNDPQIAKLNAGVLLPDLPIKVIYRPAGKGTNYVFTDFLSKTNSKFRAKIGTTPSPRWPVGTPAERSSDMADRVKAETGTIGYGELQYAVKGDISYGRVLNPSGKYVLASPESITAACRAVEAPGWDKFSASLTNAPGADSYPITSFTWLYLRSSSIDARRKAALADLLHWIYTDGQQIAPQEGYSDLPPQLLAKVRTKTASLR